MNSVRINSSHSSIAPSSIHAFSWQKYSYPVGNMGVSVFFWKSTLEVTLFHLHTLSLQDWPILCLAWTPARNGVHLMLPLQESAKIHEYPFGTSILLPSITCTQSTTLHHLIWQKKFDTNQMPFLTQFASSLPFPAHKAWWHIWEENHKDVPINYDSLNASS